MKFMDVAAPPIIGREPNFTITPHSILDWIEEPDTPFLEYMLLRMVRCVPRAGAAGLVSRLGSAAPTAQSAGLGVVIVGGTNSSRRRLGTQSAPADSEGLNPTPAVTVTVVLFPVTVVRRCRYTQPIPRRDLLVIPKPKLVYEKGGNAFVAPKPPKVVRMHKEVKLYFEEFVEMLVVFCCFSNDDMYHCMSLCSMSVLTCGSKWGHSC